MWPCLGTPTQSRKNQNSSYWYQQILQSLASKAVFEASWSRIPSLRYNAKRERYWLSIESRKSIFNEPLSAWRHTYTEHRLLFRGSHQGGAKTCRNVLRVLRRGCFSVHTVFHTKRAKNCLLDILHHFSTTSYPMIMMYVSFWSSIFTESHASYGFLSDDTHVMQNCYIGSYMEKQVR